MRMGKENGEKKGEGKGTKVKRKNIKRRRK